MLYLIFIILSCVFSPTNTHAIQLDTKKIKESTQKNFSSFSKDQHKEPSPEEIAQTMQQQKMQFVKAFPEIIKHEKEILKGLHTEFKSTQKYPDVVMAALNLSEFLDQTQNWYYLCALIVQQIPHDPLATDCKEVIRLYNQCKKELTQANEAAEKL